MANGNYEDTHEKIIESGLAMFLANGFERTNLRELCRKAGITTGAFYRHFESKEELFSFLVQPAVDEIRKDFADAEPVCREAVESGNLKKLWMVMDADGLLDYIYRNFDALKLLLACADGTKYSDFLDEAVRLETDITQRSLKRAKELGYIKPELPSGPELHMICHAYISGVFESVLHDFTRDDMERYIHTIFSFFEAGSYALLGL